MLRISARADKWVPTALFGVAYIGVTHDVALVEVVGVVMQTVAGEPEPEP